MMLRKRKQHPAKFVNRSGIRDRDRAEFGPDIGEKLRHFGRLDFGQGSQCCDKAELRQWPVIRGCASEKRKIAACLFSAAQGYQDRAYRSPYNFVADIRRDRFVETRVILSFGQ